MSEPTTSYGHPLSPGDHTDIDDIPVCCDEDMDGKDTAGGDRDYACGNCAIVVSVSANGLVSNITG